MALTTLRDAQIELNIEKSRFICTLRKVHTEAEAQEMIKGLKKQYWDATHNCSAYVIGEGGTLQRSNDDGEPSGTAGLPMLEVLRKQGLCNVAVVVTRYFGGIKLGAGGLVRAYTNSVATAVRAAGLAQLVEVGLYTLAWPVEEVGRVLNQLYQQQLFTIDEVAYGAQEAVIAISLPTAEQEKVEQYLTETLSRSIELEQVGAKIIEQEVTRDEL